MEGVRAPMIIIELRAMVRNTESKMEIKNDY